MADSRDFDAAGEMARLSNGGLGSGLKMSR